jgi:hypothetical protein
MERERERESEEDQRKETTNEVELQASEPDERREQKEAQ